MGSTVPFEIHSDHKNLEFFRKPQRINPRQARWVTELQNYHFTLIHKPGSSMTQADPLSRRPDLDIGDDHLKDVVVLKKEWFRPVTVAGSNDIIDDVKRIRYPTDLINKTNYDESLSIEDDLIYRKGKLIIPMDKNLIGKIISSHHDSVSAGHPGMTKTQDLIY